MTRHPSAAGPPAPDPRPPTRDSRRSVGGRSERTVPATFQGVSKWYGPVIAVNDVSTRFHSGITGLVGANGAGKSTFIKLLTGQLRPSLGKVTIDETDAWSPAVKSIVGYCPDVDAFYEEMSGRRFVHTMARFHGLRRRDAERRTEEVLTQVGMAERAERRLRGYSKGMRQRIKLAQALVPDPKLIVLDEPLNGVDPVGRAELVRLFRELASEGRAILISTHILEEMDKLADRILFLCRGRLLASGTLDQIRDLLDEYPRQVSLSCDDARRLAVELMGQPSVQAIQMIDPRRIQLSVVRPGEFYQHLNKIVVEGDYDVERLVTTDATTEAVFDYLTRRSRSF